ncbi:hypothetical protein SCHPADRAFT_293610 [Schizopora paradoxa]|uniref:Heterokaryon incompatibility domain-containing protein n=1 Tax=Schizopora paradoxa TaxID=27342 RepID=A0A0H2RSH9_9AGAM|nr:hypothetical protein SCHPADRAFT_293610 [Schizopora paradoxa]
MNSFSRSIENKPEAHLGVGGLPSDLAESRYTTSKELLMQLNRVFKTSLKLDCHRLEQLLESFISQGLDFGAICARSRRIWPRPLDPIRRDEVWWSIKEGKSWSEIEAVERFSFMERLGTVNTFVHDADPNDTQNAVKPAVNNKPRRLWDLHANRIIPYHYSYLLRSHSSAKVIAEDFFFCVIEHDWTNDEERFYTPINEYKWHVPLPKNVDLEAIRRLLLDKGQEYAWLDVLCLCQESQDPVKEEVRREEWAVDWPIIRGLIERRSSWVLKCSYRDNRVEFSSRSPITGIEKLKVGVPMQEEAILHPDVLNSKQADVHYTGAEQIVGKLNEIFNTTLAVDPLRDLLDSLISQGLDFGSIYARLRPNVDPLSIKTNFLWPMESTGGLKTLDLPNARTSKGRDREDVTFRAISIGTAFAERHGKLDAQDREKSIDGQSIVNQTSVKPRRLWDLLANRVVPYEYSYSFRKRNQSSGKPLDYPFCAISHSWTDDMVKVDTPINGHEWLVPVPKGIKLEVIRTELLNMGAEYVWLDVLCLRQHSLDPTKEEIRTQEWEVDLPTIGVVFDRYAHRVVRYMNGLGRPFEAFGWDHEKHWLNRAWTLQEVKHNSLMGGIPEGVANPQEVVSSDTGERLQERLDIIGTIESRRGLEAFPLLINSMRLRSSANPVDKVLGIAMICCKDRLPIYKEKDDTEKAWTTCLEYLPPAFVVMFIFNFLGPGDGSVAWRPSWNQLMSKDVLERFGISFYPVHKGRPMQVFPDGSASYMGPTYDGHFTPTKRGRGVISMSGIWTFEVRLDPNTNLPSGSYTLLGCYEYESRWVLGTMSYDSSGGALSKLFRKMATLIVGESESESESDDSPTKEVFLRSHFDLFKTNEPLCRFV